MTKDEVMALSDEDLNANVRAFFDGGVLKGEIRRLEDYLGRINAIMWKSLCIKNYPFGRREGIKIMQVLEEWCREDTE